MDNGWQVSGNLTCAQARSDDGTSEPARRLDVIGKLQAHQDSEFSV